MAFRINYSKVITQANSISNNAAELSTQTKFLSQIEQECKAAWKSDAANVFLTKLNELKNNLIITQKQMSNLAATIKYCADQIQHEDEKAARKAANLSSGR